MDTNRLWKSTYDMLPLRFSSLAASDEGVLFAGTFGHGVFQFSALHSWECASQGLPEDILIYRLDWVDSQLFAATSLGLYRLEDDIWQSTPVRDPCYRTIGWGDRFVLTANGLMCGGNGNWIPLAYPGKTTFDLLVTPQFLFLGYEDGIAFYVLLTGDWCNIPLTQSVTSLAVFNQLLLGTSADGGLVMGNKKGGFHQIRFEGMFLYRLVSHSGEVYVCASTGVYKLSALNGRLMLRSMSAQAAVTDLLIWKDMMLISTLHSGIQYRTTHRSGFQSYL